jgi:hypothetical protein
VDTSRVSFGEMVAAASAIALFIFMFLPWYGVDVNVSGFSASESVNGWEALSLIDILLFLAVLVAVGAAVARATGNVPQNLPAPLGTIVMAAGALAVLLILFRILDIPAGDVPDAVEDSVDLGRKIGVFLSLIAAGGIAFGGYTAANERADGPAPPAGGTPGTAPPPPPPPEPEPESESESGPGPGPDDRPPA